MPDNYPPCRHLPVTGIVLQNEARCNMQNVTLTRLTFNSSGRYRCEVSTEAPNFLTVYYNTNMTVVALPREPPMIEGVLSSYTLGDTVRALCTSDKSNPPSHLTWYINGVKAERWILQQDPATSLRVDDWLEEQATVAPPPDEQGLYTRTLSLSFVTEKRFFSEPTRQMELRCTATVGNQTWSREVHSSLTKLTNLGLAQERLDNTAHRMVSPSGGALTLLLCYLLTS